MRKPKCWNKLSVGVQLAASVSQNKKLRQALILIAKAAKEVKKDVPTAVNFAAEKDGIKISVTYPNPEKCKRCGSTLIKGHCRDFTCPFSDHKQTCPAGWTGHPEVQAGKCTCKK